ncbi:hypothetical protein O6H91_Y240000 [Diphasiastrum complanatum]|nr:hypothetical protein O6H91_Y240000 [Diphasiastrum complanatum]
MDQVLRASRLAGYLITRTSWMAFPGEASYEDSNVDGWLQRFLVLQGSCIYYYLRATDLRPQGTILLSEIIEISQLLPQIHSEGGKERFTFHITNCHGFRLECCSSLRYQVKAWLTAIRTTQSYHLVHHSFHSPSTILEKSTTLASWLDVAPEQSSKWNERY